MRTVRETLYEAGCAGCATTVRVAVAAGARAEHRAVAAVVAAHGWEDRDYGDGLILVCPACATSHPDLASCAVVGHDWEPVSRDGATTVLECRRCPFGQSNHPAHRPVADPTAASLPTRQREDLNAWWSPAGGGGVDHLTVVEHRLRDVEAGRVLETTG